jgi:hypothetical protein
MKSLSDQYSAAHTSTHETFADLVFCALVVLVLFVVTLAVEVSQRVRATLVEVEEVPKVELPEAFEDLSTDELRELSEAMQRQQRELEAYKQRLQAQNEQIRQMQTRLSEQTAEVANQMAALQGEQRFTGATEPAVLQVAYDYNRDRFVFVRRKEFERAITRRSGESNFEYLARVQTELAELALHCRKQRFFSANEVRRIHAAISQYQEIVPGSRGYTVEDAEIGVNYSSKLSSFIVGDLELTDAAASEVELAVYQTFDEPGATSEAMYPSLLIEIDPGSRVATVNGVRLQPTELKEFLLAVGGRGLMLDFEGYQGAAPEWLMEEVLIPTGYVGKTPKIPE